MTENPTIYPVKPITQEAIDEAIDKFDDDGCDFDGLCIESQLVSIVARALCEYAGDDWYDEPLADYSERVWLDQGSRVIGSLILAGVLRRDDFIYEDHHLRRL